MLETVSFYSLVVLFCCIGLSLIRIILGPTQADRAVAADNIFLNMVGIAAVYSVYLKTRSYFDLVFVFSLLGFIGVICFSKFLARGKIID